MDLVFKFLGWVVFACVKFMFTPGSMIATGSGYWETVINTLTGAILGALLFFFSGKGIFAFFDSLFKKKDISKKKNFTRKNKIVVKIKMKFGVWGLALLVGVLSVPLTALLAARFFKNKKKTIGALISAIIIWTFFLTSIAYGVRHWVEQ